MFYNNPNFQCFKMFLKTSSHKNGHFVLQYDMSPYITVHQNTIRTWENLPLFLNHVFIIWKYFVVIIMKTLNSIEDKIFYSNIMGLHLPFKKLNVHNRIYINWKTMTIKSDSTINLNHLSCNFDLRVKKISPGLLGMFWLFSLACLLILLFKQSNNIHCYFKMLFSYILQFYVYPISS